MAKVSFTKLGLSKEKMNQNTTIHFNEQTIEIKQYLPINEKLELVGRVIGKSADENNFANPVKLDVFAALEIMYAYTNINFTDRQKEDEIKLYDLFVASGLWDKVMHAIPAEEYSKLISAIHACAEAIYTYRNSILGLLETISSDYDNLNLDIETIREKIGDPEALGLVKEVLTKLG